MVNEKISVSEPWRHQGTHSPFSILNSLLTIFLFCLISSAFAQWTPRTGNMGQVRSIVESSWGDLYAGTSSGIRRLEEGVGWVRADSGLPVDSVEGITVWDLAVKGEYLFAATDSGVYRHSGGNGWIATMDSNVFITDLMVKDSVLFAGSRSSNGGVFRSYDDGNSWSRINNGLISLWVNDLVAMGSALFVSTAGKVLFRSDDEGNNWTQLDSIFEYGRSSLAVVGSWLYAGGLGGVYRSGDSGATWERIEDLQLIPSSWIVFEEKVFVGGAAGKAKVYFSNDDGNTWQEWSEGLNEDSYDRGVNSLLIHDGYLLAGTYSRICGGNSCDDVTGRVWQRPLSEVVSIGPKPTVRSDELRIIRGSGGSIEFTLQQSGWAELSLYTPGGKLVATLVQEEYTAGTHRISPASLNLPGGVYVARLKTQGISHAQKIFVEE